MRGSARVSLGSFLSLALLVFAFLELQPPYCGDWSRRRNLLAGLAASAFPYLQGLTAFFASIGTVVAVLARSVADALKRAKETPAADGFCFRAPMLKLTAMYAAGVAIPFVIWVADLYSVCVGYSARGLAGRSSTDQSVQRSPYSTFDLAVGIVLLGLSALLDANANSLHRLYAIG